jgi:hypothetical protein
MERKMTSRTIREKGEAVAQATIRIDGSLLATIRLFLTSCAAITGCRQLFWGLVRLAARLLHFYQHDEYRRQRHSAGSRRTISTITTAAHQKRAATKAISTAKHQSFITFRS